MTRDLPGKKPLGAFALYIARPQWIEVKPLPGKEAEIVAILQGAEDVPIQVRRDGFIIFEFDKAPRYTGGDVPEAVVDENRKIPKEYSRADRAHVKLGYKRFDYMTAFLQAMFSGYSSVQKLGTPVQPPINPVNYFATIQNAKGEWLFHQEYTRNLDYPLGDRAITQLDTIKHAVELMEKCKGRFERDYIDILKLTYIACHQYSIHQFESAHIIAWTVVERLLNEMWGELVKEVDAASGGHTALSKDRRDQLLKGRDYSASVITQVLSLSRKLEDELLERLDAARKTRNAFVHKMQPIEHNEAGKVIRVATDLITNLVGFRVTSQLSLGYYI